MATISERVFRPVSSHVPQSRSHAVALDGRQAGRVSTRGFELSERRAMLLLGELAASGIALALATASRGWWDAPGNAPVVAWFVTLFMLDIVLGHASDAHNLRRAANAFHGSYVSARTWLTVCVLYLTIPYLSAPLLQSRAALLLFITAGLILRISWRSAYALLVRQPRFVTRVAIVGTGPAAAVIADAIRTHLGPEYHVLGCIGEHEEHQSPPDLVAPSGALSILGGPAELERLLARGEVSTVILATAGVMPSELYAGVIRAYETGVRVLPMPVFYEAVTGRVPVEHVGDYWYVSLPKMEQDWLYRAAKRTIDLIGALVGCACFLAALPFIAAAVRFSGPGPILYAQRRLGQHGRLITVRKFRTMLPHAEADGVARWAQAGDPRVTRVGRFLRAARLDELPQFWNVLKGEMSLVGPRPERPEFIDQLQQQVPFYRVRLLVPPGLTGWAQVKHQYAGSREETLVKLQYDLYYISHQSLYLDFLILLKTVAVVLRLRGV